MGHHLAWKAALGTTVPVGDPIVSIHHEFSEITQVAQSCDRIDGPNLASMELVARQLQLSEDRYKDKLVCSRPLGVTSSFS
eukprot:4692680-Pyramimonas_sp.AAC.1